MVSTSHHREIDGVGEINGGGSDQRRTATVQDILGNCSPWQPRFTGTTLGVKNQHDSSPAQDAI